MTTYKERYFLSSDFNPTEVEVTMEKFMEAERNAGFHSNVRGRPATAGFSGNGISGRVEFVKIP